MISPVIVCPTITNIILSCGIHDIHPRIVSYYYKHHLSFLAQERRGEERRRRRRRRRKEEERLNEVVVH
jgi:hypothetical protein